VDPVQRANARARENRSGPPPAEFAALWRILSFRPRTDRAGAAVPAAASCARAPSSSARTVPRRSPRPWRPAPKPPGDTKTPRVLT